MFVSLCNILETPAGFPEVTNYPEMVERPGRSYLTCDIVSDWPFNITWYKNSYPVSDSSRIFQEMGMYWSAIYL